MAGEIKNFIGEEKGECKKTIPKLSSAIIVSIISIILIPFLNALANLAEYAWLKVLITSSPLLIVFGFWAFTYFYKKKKISLQDLFYLYQQKDMEEVSEETISEDEPSIKKFREWMMELSDDLQKNVIIVFDNMDRLPPEKVQIVWALVYTFFSFQPYSKITVIVPFDRTHIKNAFGMDDADNFEKTNHFINKTFSVIFNISPAVLTDWKGLFKDKFEEAFGENEKDEFAMSRKLFDLHNPTITPRKIIAFINELVSYKLIWKGKIYLRYIALFVLNRQQIILNPVSQILNKQFLTNSHNLFAGDDEVSDNMAALLYNVELKQALQVTLQRQIEIAIRENRVDDLKEFCKNADFLTILDQISTDDIEVATSASCLDKIESSIVNPDQGHLQIIWDRIIGTQLTLPIKTEIFADEHKILIAKARALRLKPLIKYLINEFFTVAEPSGSKYFKALNDLENYLKEKEIEIDCTSYINIRVLEPKLFVDYLQQAKSEYGRYKVSSNNQLLEKFYLEKIPDDLEACITIHYLKGEYKFPGIKDAVEKLIKADEITIENLTSIFDIYKKVNSSTLLSSKLSDPKISELLELAKPDSNQYYELCAMRLARGINYSGTGSRVESILKDVDNLFITQVSNKIQFYSNYGKLLLDVIEFPEPLLKAVLKMMTTSELGNSMNIEKVIPKFKEIVNAIDVTPKEFILKLNGWNNSLKEKLTVENLNSLIPDIIVFENAVEIKNDLSNSILEVATKYITKTTEPDFSSAYMDSESYLFSILFLLLKNDVLDSLPGAAFTSYKDALKSIASSKENTYLASIDMGKWNVLYDKSDKLHLQPIIKDIRDVFLRDIDISNEQFLFFERLLREQAALNEKTGEVVRKIMVPVSKDEGCLSAILNKKEYYATLIDEAGNDAFSFIDFIRHKIEEVSDNSNIVLFEKMINGNLAKRIKILEANYFSPSSSDITPIDITEKLRKIVEGETQLHFLVNNGIVDGHDPDPEKIKNLWVKYTFNEEEKQKTFDEHNWFSLP